MLKSSVFLISEVHANGIGSNDSTSRFSHPISLAPIGPENILGPVVSRLVYSSDVEVGARSYEKCTPNVTVFSLIFFKACNDILVFSRVNGSAVAPDSY